MKYAIGIDTGGTYTDGVIYDFSTQTICASAKALTTKGDLSVGIGNCLNGLPLDLLKKAELVSLSTTLATNASVENKLGKAKLVFIGADKEIVERTGKKYGLNVEKDILYIDGEIDYRGVVVKEPDWEDFVEKVGAFMEDAQALAIVQQLGVRNSSIEKKAKEMVKNNFNKEAICGHELFGDLNYIKRGASTLLNARLIPVIGEFLKAIKVSLEKHGVQAPVVIVRSDGSLMSQDFTTVRPVETLLCGPAASVVGAMALSNETDGIVLDMGGTTTDMAMVENREAVITKDGVRVGDWETFVKSVDIETFALGGDSWITIDKYHNLELNDNRVIPLSIASKEYPNLKGKIKKLPVSRNISIEPYYESFIYLREPNEFDRLSETEQLLVDHLKKEKIITFFEVGTVINKKLYSSYIYKLERKGIVMRVGLTPTDLMHVNGDFTNFDQEIASLVLDYISYHTEKKVQTLIKEGYDLVKRKMYYNVVKMLLKRKFKTFNNEWVESFVKEAVEMQWTGEKARYDFMDLLFQSRVPLIGVGAPIHVFLPEVAKALNAPCIIPQDGKTANALGAVVSEVSVSVHIEVKPDPKGGFIVFGRKNNSYTPDYDEAIEIGKREALELVEFEAKKRGAHGNLKIEVGEEKNKNLEKMLAKGKFLSTKIVARAVGKIVD
ncbi:MAG TPA: hypothetical protein DHN33_07775 [Eubacteriaceae bacterium]|nr:hypothetical protein [Eubacteriaceae bacterium]